LSREWPSVAANILDERNVFAFARRIFFDPLGCMEKDLATIFGHDKAEATIFLPELDRVELAQS
jgi:hypothetical protein